MSFGPISALGAQFLHGVPVFKPAGATISAILEILEYLPRWALASLAPPVTTHLYGIDQEGSPAMRGNLTAAWTLNQNPIFEMPPENPDSACPKVCAQ